MAAFWFTRAGRAGEEDLSTRIPELSSLKNACIAVFGLGSLGAPSATEFAKAGVGELRILDCDFVDPGCSVRWPIGLSASGRKKASIIKELVERDYPKVTVRAFDHRLGTPSDISSRPSDGDIIRQMSVGANLIFDATAETGVQHLLTDYARETKIPYIGVVGTIGAWGGRIFRLTPGKTKGCWICFRRLCESKAIPEPNSMPNGDIQPIGCGDPTFTGSNFDMLTIALTAVRLSIAQICATQSGYPDIEVDGITINFRNSEGAGILPTFEGFKIEKTSNCPCCDAGDYPRMVVE